MSMIQSSWALLGWRSSLIAGTARWRTVRSITYSRQARARTLRPIHSRRPARGGILGSAVIVVAVMSLGIPVRCRFHPLRPQPRRELIGCLEAMPAFRTTDEFSMAGGSDG